MRAIVLIALGATQFFGQETLPPRRDSVLQDGTPPAYLVGVHTELIVDDVRVLDTGARRTLQITVWYPARRGSAAPVTYGDYLDLRDAERGVTTDFARASARMQLASFLVDRGLTKAAVSRWLQTSMRAVRDAASAGGRFPLVVIVHGNGQSAVDQSTLGEHLAASGYVVATSPSYTRISRPPTSEADLGSGAEEQADDIALLYRRMAQHPNVDSTRVGIVAHSLGARGALFYVMRNPVAKVLVSLDGGIGTATGRAAMEHSTSFAPRHVAASILHFYETTDAFMAPDLTLLHELSGSQILIARTPVLHHHHFTSLGAWCAVIPGLQQATGAAAETSAVYAAVVEVTRAYLDSSLKGDRRAFSIAKAAASRPAATRPAIEFSTLDGPGRR